MESLRTCMYVMYILFLLFLFFPRPPTHLHSNFSLLFKNLMQSVRGDGRLNKRGGSWWNT